MRLTVRTNLAMRTLMHCAVRAPEHIRSADVAEACNASFHHIAQVVAQLEAAGYLHTTRGRGGGIALARPASEIRVGEVFRTFEGELPFAECMAGDANTCPLRGACRLQGLLHKALRAFYAELDEVTVADLVEDNAPLQAIFAAGEHLTLAMPRC